MAAPPKLPDRVREAIRARHYSRRTEVAYVRCVRFMSAFIEWRISSTLGAKDISAFLTWLVTIRHISASTQNQASAALLFLYERVVGQSVAKVEHVVPAKMPVRLRLVLAHLDGLWIVGMLLYGAGPRLEECLALRVKDIDFDRR